MPEVCEVCLTAMYLNRKIRNKTIMSINILGGRYTHQPLVGLEEAKENLPLKIKKVDSKGKFMWMELKNGNQIIYMLNTYGLTGKWGFKLKKNSRISIKLKSNSGNEYILYYTDPRNFGIIKFTSEKGVLQAALDKRGPDFLKESFTRKEFEERVYDYIYGGRYPEKKYDKKIVAVLMNQEMKTGIGSGLGNYLVPEILYRAKISPHRKIGDILNDKKALYKLAKYIKYVLKLCYLTNDTEYVDHIKGFLRKHKEDVNNNRSPNYHKEINIKDNKFEFFVYGQSEDPKNNPVKREEIVKGRTTYWVPNVQT